MCQYENGTLASLHLTMRSQEPMERPYYYAFPEVMLASNWWENHVFPFLCCDYTSNWVISGASMQNSKKRSI